MKTKYSIPVIALVLLLCLCSVANAQFKKGFLYVTEATGNRISEIDPLNKTIAVFKSGMAEVPQYITFDYNHELMYVSAQQSGLLKIDASGNVANLGTAMIQAARGVSVFGDLLYTVSATTGQIFTIDLAENIQLLQSGLNAPSGTDMDVDGNLYVAASGKVFKVLPSGEMNQLISTTPLTAEAVAVTRDDLKALYVSHGVSGKVSRYSSSGAQETQYSGLSFPKGVAVDLQGNLYVVESQLGQITMITPEGTKTPLVGGLGKPVGIAIYSESCVDTDEDGVCNFKDNCIDVGNTDQLDLDNDKIGDACDKDKDGDGYEAGSGENLDCNDADKNIHPGSPETINDKIDSNCNSQDNCGIFKTQAAKGYLIMASLLVLPLIGLFTIRRARKN
jgi:DNA-binding beta-propeller fold protein YncE